VTLTRRNMLSSTGAVFGSTALGSRAVRAAGSLRPVKMLLDWIYQGPNAGFMVAKSKGIYEQAGLDVQIEAGKGSGSTAQLIASNVAQFGFCDGFVLGFSAAKGMDLKMIASVYRRNPAGVMVLASSGLKTPKDLEGKSVGIAPGSAQFQQFPAFLRGCNVDVDKVRVVNVDPAGAGPALITGRVDAIGGFVQGYVPSIEVRGNKETGTMWYADCGVDVVSNGIIARPATLKENPALARDFVAASMKGFLYARQNPDEAIAILKTYLESIEPAISRRELELSWKTWVTPNTAGKPLGWMSEKDWASTVKTLTTYGGVTTPLDTAALYTNEYVPAGAEFVPPQT
jgi:NitT/TauT family transport system substrate-binding protein